VPTADWGRGVGQKGEGLSPEVGSQRIASHTPLMIRSEYGRARKEGCCPRTEHSSNQIKLYYDRRSVGQPVLVSGTPLGLSDQFFPN
jgi:hypothetical protein